MTKTEKNENAKIKFNKFTIITAVFSAAFIACVLVSVIFGLKLPKVNREFLSDGDNYTAQTLYSEKEILYASKEKLFLTENDGKIKKTVAAKDEVNQKFGIYAGRIQSVYKEKDDKNFFVTAMNAETGKNYVVEFNENFSPVSISTYDGDYRAMKRMDGYLFIITETSGYFNILRYSADNLGEKPVKGNLFTGSDDGDIVSLTMTKGEKILSVDDVNGKLYILTTSGFAAIDTSLSGCGYIAEYEEKLAQLKTENPEEDESELSRLAREHVISNHAGLKTFNPNGGTIGVNSLDFDQSEYLYLPAEVGAYVGGAYVAENDNYYLIGSDGETFKVNAKKIDETAFGDALECDKAQITLKGMPYSDNKALYYNVYENTAYVIYKNLSDITKIEKIVYSVEADFKIDSIVAADGIISYLYQNANISASGTIIKATFDEDSKINGGLYKALFITFVVLSVVLFAVSAIMIACVFSVGFKGRTAKLLKSMARAKLVYLTILPSFVLLCLFCFYPAIASIGLSFFDYTQSKPMLLWNNFKHYINIFTSADAALAFSNMALFLVSDLITSLVPPLIFAFFLTVMGSRKYSAVARTLLFIPGIIPSITGLLIWQTGIYGYSGVLNKIITACGGSVVKFLENPSTAKWSIIAMGFPFVGSYLIFYGAMMNIPPSFYEAAELEGCGVWKRFFTIDIPLIMSQIKYVIVCTFIASLQNFARTYMVNKNATNGTITPIHEMYRQMLADDYGYSAAYATVIFVFLLFATIINMKMQFKKSEDD